MSIATEIARISKNVSDSLDAVANKGVLVPIGSNSDDLPELIAQITSGSGSVISIVDEQDSHGGTIRHINAVSLEGDTVSPAVLYSGYTAHNSLGEPIIGTASGGGITPTGNINITHAGQTNVTNYATATVSYADATGSVSGRFITESGVTKFRIYGEAYAETSGWVDGDSIIGTSATKDYAIVPSNTTVTPTTSQQTIGGYEYMMQGPVTVAAMPSGTAGTPTAIKGSVSNHSVSVTPSVTNTTGYITGGTKTGTAVTVQASELVSGSETKTTNGTYDVTNLAQIIVDVQGGSSSMSIATATTTPSTASSSIQFTGLSGEPTSFVVTSAGNLATGASPYKTAAVVFDGTDLHGQIVTNTSNAQASYNTNFTKSYSNGTLTITGSGTNFQTNEYKLVYTYGGNSSNLGTAQMQVGSGATSVTFTGLTEEPDYFSVIFKSNFSTSSGYQRVMSVAYDGTNIYGVAMDSGAKALSSWSYTYNNGSLTVTSAGTNNGGYFHQPGYYQLTYGVGASVGPSEIQVEPLSVVANGTYTAPTGKAYSPVTVSVPSGGITPTGNINITQAGITDVTNYATATVPQGEVVVNSNEGYYTENGNRKWHYQPKAGINAGEGDGTRGYLDDFLTLGTDHIFNAIPANTTITPSTSSQTIGGADYMMAGAVTVSAMPSGTAGTPTATKGTVSNHSISITPSVTNTTGYITGSTKTGTAVTVSASELVSGSETKTANGTYDVTNLASLVVNVSGGGGVGTLINTTSLGSLSTTSTSGTNTNKTLSITGYNDYDLLIVDISVDSAVNNRHTGTISFILLTGTSTVSTKNTYTVVSNKWNSRLGSTGTASTRQSTTAYGVYANSVSVSGSTMSIPIYYKYNSSNTGTINGNYTARVYGLNLIDLIGG